MIHLQSATTEDIIKHINKRYEENLVDEWGERDADGMKARLKELKQDIRITRKENAKLANELDTARDALKNSIKERREESDEKDKRIRYLENKLMAIMTINKEESDYDCEMRGFNL